MAERERETLEVDVLFVGAGPASLSGALHLRQLIENHNQSAASGARKLDAVSIAVIEKGREIGAHTLSGAILDPVALKELLPNYQDLGAPLGTPVTHDTVCLLTATDKFAFPFIPPPLQESRQLHHLSEPVCEMDGRAGRVARHRPVSRICRNRAAVRRETPDRRSHRGSWDWEGWPAARFIRARSRYSGQGGCFRRGRARLAHQATDKPAAAGRREKSAGLCHRREGSLGTCPRKVRRRGMWFTRWATL